MTEIVICILLFCAGFVGGYGAAKYNSLKPQPPVNPHDEDTSESEESDKSE